MICTKCNKDKDKCNYTYRNSGKLNKWCNDCRKEYQENYYKKNQEENVNKAIKRNKKRRIEIIKYLRKQKDKLCKDCGNKFPHYVMDFHHLYNKVYNVSDLVNKGSFTLLEQEIEKCIVICSNCHRIRTWKERHRE